MGAWGPGLYSDDFALDMRAVLSAVTKLPFEGKRLLEILSELHPEIASNPDNEDYCSFWLVIADQFQKRGVSCPEATEKALKIIDEDVDINNLTSLGMQKSILNKRKKMLGALRVSLTEISTKKRAAVLKKPYEYQADVGDILVFPTSNGDPRNPYASEANLILLNWNQDGWRAAIIIDRGKTFGFLPWYTPLVTLEPFADKPSLEQLQKVKWAYGPPGTLSKNHFQKMSIEIIGNLPIDLKRLYEVVPARYLGDYWAVQDISIANSLGESYPEGQKYAGTPPTIIRNLSLVLP